jgi:hypothetical protein
VGFSTHQPNGPPWPVTGIDLLFILTFMEKWDIMEAKKRKVKMEKEIKSKGKFTTELNFLIT